MDGYNGNATVSTGADAATPAAVAQYIASQREAFRPRAFPLTEEQRLAVEGFFVPEAIDGVRLVVLQNNRVQNP